MTATEPTHYGSDQMGGGTVRHRGLLENCGAPECQDAQWAILGETAPFGCRWCGLEQRGHMQRWKPHPGWHTWTPPAQDLIKQRMLARRALRQEPRR